MGHRERSVSAPPPSNVTEVHVSAPSSMYAKVWNPIPALSCKRCGKLMLRCCGSTSRLGWPQLEFWIIS